MTEATHGPAKVSQRRVRTHWESHTEFVVSCDACKLEPMTGLTYSGAVNLAETHNAINHGKDADNV